MRNAHAGLLDYMLIAIRNAFGIAGHGTLEKTRKALQYRCAGFELLNVPNAQFRNFLRYVLDTEASDRPWLLGVLDGLVHKPTEVWSDYERDVAESELSDLSEQLLHLESRSMRSVRLGDEGSTASDLQSVYLGTVCVEHGSMEALVVFDGEVLAAVAEQEEQIREVMLRLGDDELRLKLVATVAHDLLLDYCGSEVTATHRGKVDSLC